MDGASRRGMRARGFVGSAAVLGAVGLLAGGCSSSSTPAPASTTASTPGATSSSTAGSATTSSTASTSSATTSAGRSIAITVTGSTVTPTPTQVDLPVGQTLTLVVTSDHDDELHAHGFEVEETLKAGQPTTLTLTGKDSGVFEVETHHPALTLLTVAVR